jgi:hypothetical protein
MQGATVGHGRKLLPSVLLDLAIKLLGLEMKDLKENMLLESERFAGGWSIVTRVQSQRW